MKSPEEILGYMADLSVKKVEKPLLSKFILAFMGGMMIALGYMSYIRIESLVEGGAGTLLASLFFPVGLIIILLGGLELTTSNIMVVAYGFIIKKVGLRELFANWLIITLGNIIGAIFVAGVFGIGAGVMMADRVYDIALHVADSKLTATPTAAFLSGIGCSVLVGMAALVSFGIKEASGKILAIWFIISTFVIIGFQHSIANSFIIPFAIMNHEASWLDFIGNFVPVYLGNVVGGAIFVAFFYSLGYKKK
ncbi:formate/nitrite transporter family protein [Streptococcaceae bacterium ESL0729]|nr:formate/nitrite transporter family protein [Streptococcaceae bacterium ESL0729]